MKRRAVSEFFISVLLITALAGALLINIVAANPLLLSLKVNIVSPQPETYSQNLILVAFTYSAQTEIDVPVNSLPNHYYYDLDEQKEVPFTPVFIGSSGRERKCYTYIPCSNGVHSLTIYVTAWRQGELIHYGGYSTVTFTVDAIPRVDVSSPQNKTYNKSDVQLHFIVDQPVSRATYCLDGQANITVALNTTLIKEIVWSRALPRVAVEGNELLTGLALGEHSVTVYAWGETGNVCTLKTVVFSVEDASRAIPSPTQSPSTTPSSTPNSESRALVTAATTTAIAFIAAVLLFCFKKHKG